MIQVLSFFWRNDILTDKTKDIGITHVTITYLLVVLVLFGAQLKNKPRVWQLKVKGQTFNCINERATSAD